LLGTSKLVLSRDPLLSGINPKERIRRLLADLEVASEELRSCLSKKQEDQSGVFVLQPLWTEIDQDMQTQFTAKVLSRDPEGITTGLNLVRRIELATEQICGESSSLHTALLLIARKQGVGEQ